jgi:hypothetical protein
MNSASWYGIGLLVGAFLTAIDIWAGGSRISTFWILAVIGAIILSVSIISERDKP